MSAAVAKKGEDPTKAPVDRLQDESMNYLQHHKLEDAVCDALVKVVNERAANPRERMAQLLLGSKEGGGTLPMSKQATEKYEKQIADLQSENRRLKEELERNQVRAQQQINELTATKASSPAPPPAALPAAKATPKPAAAPAPAAAAKPATPATPDARSVMATLFELLQPTASGVITQNRVQALAATFEMALNEPVKEEGDEEEGDEEEAAKKKADREAEREAQRETMPPFIEVLRAMAASAPSSGASGKGYLKDEWLAAYERAYTGQQKAKAMGNLSSILDDKDAREGLVVMVNRNEQTMVMEDLFKKVLVQGQAGNKITSDRINKFIEMLRKGEADPNTFPEEKAAISAFVPVLERLSKTGKTYTEDDWKKAEWTKEESDAFTADEQESLLRVVKVLSVLLASHKAVERLCEAMKE